MQRLAAATAACGADWDFDGEGVSREDAITNLGLIESADVCYNALLRDEGKVDGTTAGIAPGSGNKGVLRTILQFKKLQIFGTLVVQQNTEKINHLSVFTLTKRKHQQAASSE